MTLPRILLLVPLPLLWACLSAAPAAAQTFVRWDTALFGQPGQRSLFLRTPNGGIRGLPLGAGDVNEDGREDVLVCAFQVAEAFLFFSPPAIAGVRESVPVPGEVTRIAGAFTLGVECAAGDVNGDGRADLLLGAPGVAAAGRAAAGAVYVIFGSPALPALIDVEATGGVLKILGADAGDHFGVWVDAVDVDGDGLDDILVGAPDADGPGNARPDAGEAYVIYGGSDLVPGSFELAGFRSANRLFTVFGADALDKTGSTVDAGRIDGSAVAELVVGSGLNRAAQVVYGGDGGGGDGPDGSRRDAGEVAIVFDPARGGSVDLAAPTADVALVFGADSFDFAGEEIDVGDADGDGFGDVLIGALSANGLGNIRGSNAGEAYLVYGGSALRGRRIDLRQPPSGVTILYGPTAGGITGDTARFIDIDGDGRGDVFVGSPIGMFLGPDGRVRTGALFFVRSPAGRLPPVIDFDDPPLESLPVGIILAADPGDILAYSLVKADADGDGTDDVVVNGMTGSGLDNQFSAAGEAYVIDGQTLAGRLEPFATGDLNGDGAADIRDLQRLIAALVGRVQLSEAERRAADTNGNGNLDVGDLIGVVDRVLQRNLLAPGSLGGGGLSKDAATPAYRYERSYGPGGAIFSLQARNRPGLPAPRSGRLSRRPQPVARGPHALGALRATFALPHGLGGPPRVLPGEGVRVFTGMQGGKLQVLVFADGALPLGRPLFGFAGPAPRLEKATAATLGGSLRALEKVTVP